MSPIKIACICVLQPILGGGPIGKPIGKVKIGTPIGGDDGTLDGATDGVVDGATDGEVDGTVDGATDGEVDGATVGEVDGTVDGAADGKVDGAAKAIGVLNGFAAMGAWIGLFDFLAFLTFEEVGVGRTGDFLAFVPFEEVGLGRTGFFFVFFESFTAVAPGKTVVTEVVVPSTGYVVVFTVSVFVLVVLDPLIEVDWEVLVEVVKPPEV